MKKALVNFPIFLFIIFAIAGCFENDPEPEKPDPTEDEVVTPFTEIPDDTWEHGMPIIMKVL